MELIKGYRKTDVGVIPTGWRLESMGKIFSFKNGINADKDAYGSGIKFINVMDVFNNHEISYSAIRGKVQLSKEQIKIYEVIKGDILFNRTSETFDEIAMASIYIGEERVVFGGFVIKGRHVLKEAYPLFSQRILNSALVRKQIISQAQGAIRANIGQSDLSKVLIPLPPLPEQKAIAQVLSDTDKLIQTLEKKIEKKRLIKQGMMQRLLQPKPGWKDVLIGEIASVTTGSKNTQDKVADGKYPFFVRSQTIERIDSYSFEGEGILTAGDGVGTGKVFHYANEKIDVHQRVYLIYDLDPSIDVYFIFLLFKKNFYARIKSMTAKSSVDSVRKEMITKMSVTIPSTINEQRSISISLRNMEQEILSNERSLEKYKKLKQGLVQQLLTGKIRLI